MPFGFLQSPHGRGGQGRKRIKRAEGALDDRVTASTGWFHGASGFYPSIVGFGETGCQQDVPNV